ncbi:MAG: AMP-binding protein [Ferrovum myxofaciens]|uniref:AMP-binding protein n=1 Tax=Ferrovum myxofaciens TaxID=416213 RepID=UPI002352A502|nr:AMP-binding protein [Ferrovum myxofaciens]QKE40381.1 MAG: AMP-binding protein [Ferrovum myxofaciens]
MNPDDQAKALLDIVQTLIGELRPGMRAVVTLDSMLDRDLGFDSLARVELGLRCERFFNVSLLEQALATIETPRDLLSAVLSAGAATRSFTAVEIREIAVEKVADIPGHAATLLEMLDWHVVIHGERTHIVLSEETGEEVLSYQTLRQGAEALAAGLQGHDVQPGQTVAIMLPTSRDYFYSFYGVLLAGGIPVPIYPPARLSQIEDHLRRHAGILNNAAATLLITVPEARPLAQLLKSLVASLRTVTTAQELSTSRTGLVRHVCKSEDIALLQYTSGSTGNPKGVVLTHANLLANIRAMGQVAQAGASDVFVSWLPLYHDMGLIGAWLGSLYHAIPLVVMSPLTFLARPERWLWAIHRHRGTLSAAPNFAYELCLRKIDDHVIEGLDLSSWRMAFNGAEPVSPDTIYNFQQRFGCYGLCPETLTPVYGLAESAVGLAFPPPGRVPIIDRIQREPFIRGGLALPAAEIEPDALRFVACGQPLPGHAIRIIDPVGHELGEREEGRLEFRGPSVTSGYFHNSEQTACLFHDGWLDSGDLAYTVAGDIYLTSRVKDIIIRAGRNIYPYELEEAAGNIAGIRKGCVAVFGSPDRVSGTERLVVMAETRVTETVALNKLREQINALAMSLLGEPPDDVVLTPPHSVLKTSSGKIRRAASRELYEKGMSNVPPHAVWQQFVRLAWTGIVFQLRRKLYVIVDALYAVYVWILFCLLAPLTWLIASILPRHTWSWGMSGVMARLFVRLSGMPFLVRGVENLPTGACVLAVNHASYLDGILVVAALSRQFSFVAKSELKDQFIPRIYLQHIGTEFVERFEFERSVEDVTRLLEMVRAGQSLIFFPEGTFYRAPGLLPFRMGAFITAAQAGVPIVPMTIRGSRVVLRDGQWFPRRGAISITIGVPILPEGTAWPDALKLRNAVRAEILRHCGEPDLAG